MGFVSTDAGYHHPIELLRHKRSDPLAEFEPAVNWGFSGVLRKPEHLIYELLGAPGAQVGNLQSVRR